MDPATFASTRQSLTMVAVHIVARARSQATERFSLRVTPGGFGTPEFGEGCRQIRVAGDQLIVTSDAPGAASATALRIDGSSLAELAAVAEVDLSAPLNVGHDTPPLGDVDAPIAVDAAAAARVAEWFQIAQTALDRVLAEVVGHRATDLPMTLPRLWPEHFDVASVASFPVDDGVNLGASPGDGFSDEPYFYVGPWGPQRPGDPGFWNAPFGGVVTWSQLSDDPVGNACRFLMEGLDRLT